MKMVYLCLLVSLGTLHAVKASDVGDEKAATKSSRAIVTDKLNQLHTLMSEITYSKDLSQDYKETAERMANALNVITLNYKQNYSNADEVKEALDILLQDLYDLNFFGRVNMPTLENTFNTTLALLFVYLKNKSE